MLATATIQDEVLRVLDEIKDPCSVGFGDPMGLVEMGLVRSVDVSPAGEVSICLRLTSPFCEMIGFFKNTAVDRIRSLPSVESVTVEADSGFDWSPEYMSPARQEQRRQRLSALRASARAGDTQVVVLSNRRGM
jgi:metal-sulfur cluster biosynthetic enzyme